MFPITRFEALEHFKHDLEYCLDWGTEFLTGSRVIAVLTISFTGETKSLPERPNGAFPKGS